jgi:hypothetical protein
MSSHTQHIDNVASTSNGGTESSNGTTPYSERPQAGPLYIAIDNCVRIARTVKDMVQSNNLLGPLGDSMSMLITVLERLRVSYMYSKLTYIH